MNYSKTMPKTTRRHVAFLQNPSGPRYKKPRRPYPWKKTELGCRALWLIYAFGRQWGTDDDFRRVTLKSRMDYEGWGNWNSCLDFIDRRLPSFRADFLERTGRELSASDLSGRWANMWRNNKNKTFTMGPEHPKIHPALLPFEEWGARQVAFSAFEYKESN